MSWSIEIYSCRETRLSDDELKRSVAEATPSLGLCDGPVAGSWALCDAQSNQRFVLILVAPFREECEADPELLTLLEQEIAESDADDGDIDAEYTTRLQSILRNARWHYTIAAVRADDPESERATVRAANALANMGEGLVHDLQSGAWMDAALFEDMLDAYGASAPF
jgi:hypothetical protein